MPAWNLRSVVYFWCRSVSNFWCVGKEPDSASKRHSEVCVPPTSPELLPTLVKGQGARRGGVLILTPHRGTSQGLDACCILTNLYYGRKVMCATRGKNKTPKKPLSHLCWVFQTWADPVFCGIMFLHRAGSPHGVQCWYKKCCCATHEIY